MQFHLHKTFFVFALISLVAVVAVADAPYSYPRCSVPYQFAQFPSNFDPWEQWDEPMMSQWNTYADIINWYSNPPGSFGAGNGNSEMAGFLTDSQVYQYYGYHWGDSTLGVTFSRIMGGCIIESDIALNADWDCWTTDPADTLDDPYCILYQFVMLHELGHTFGMDDYYKATDSSGYDSVMNYAHPRTTWALGIDDSLAIQHLYPSHSETNHDVGIYSFHCTSDQSCPKASTSSTQIRQGQSFDLENFQITNMGDYNESGFTISFYLSEDFNITTSDYKLGSVNPGNISKNSRSLVDVELDVANDAPTGRFYLGAILSGVSSDALDENNSMFLETRIRIQLGDGDDDDDDDDDDNNDDDDNDDDDDDYQRDCEEICDKLIACDYTSNYNACLANCDNFSSSVAKCLESATGCSQVDACMGEDTDDDGGSRSGDDDDGCGC